MIFKHVACAAQICRAPCYANVLPNLTNQYSSFHIFVRHEKSAGKGWQANAGKGRECMRLEVVKKNNPNFLYLYGRGAQGVYTSESQGILFQLLVGFAGKFGKPFSGKNV